MVRAYYKENIFSKFSLLLLFSGGSEPPQGNYKEVGECLPTESLWKSTKTTLDLLSTME